MNICRIKDTFDPLFEKSLLLYHESFPENERKELKYLLKPGQLIGAMYAVMDENEYAGFFCTLDVGDISHIIYLTIVEEKRNLGLGASVIETYANSRLDKRVIVDIECETEAAKDNLLRRRRKMFYMKNGFQETEVRYTWHGDDFEILSRNGLITKKEFSLFWDEIEKEDEELLY